MLEQFVQLVANDVLTNLSDLLPREREMNLIHFCHSANIRLGFCFAVRLLLPPNFSELVATLKMAYADFQNESPAVRFVHI